MSEKSLNRQIAEKLDWKVVSRKEKTKDFGVLTTYHLLDPQGNPARQGFGNALGGDVAWRDAPDFEHSLDAVIRVVRSLFVDHQDDGTWGADVNFDFLQPNAIADGKTPAEAAARALLQWLIWQEEIEAEGDDEPV